MFTAPATTENERVPSPDGRRLLSLDAFRGLTIAAMLLVNNPGRWGETTIYAPLRHADWNGWTPTDLIFPFFLFIVGVAVVFSSDRRLAEGQARGTLCGHAARRSLVLILLGLFQSRFPLVERGADGFFTTLAATGPGGWLLHLGFVLTFLAVVVLLAGIRRERRRGWLIVLAAGLATGVAGQILAHPAEATWFWHHLASARVPGVLQRIGVCYLLAATIYLFGPDGRWRTRFILAWLVVLLLGSAVWMLYSPIPGFGRPDLSIGLHTAGGEYVNVFANWCAHIDAHLFGIRTFHHLVDPRTGALVWAFDPEGLASTPAALATVLMGILCGMWLSGGRSGLRPVREGQDAARHTYLRSRLRGLLLLGALLTAAGLLLDAWIPINKRLWTSSYAVLTGGMALLFLAGCFYLMEMRCWRRWASPFVWYGRNAITAFFFSSLAATLSVHLKIAVTRPDGTPQIMALKTWLYENLFRAVACPVNASLLYAMSVVLIWMAIVGVMNRRGVFLKI